MKHSLGSEQEMTGLNGIYILGGHSMEGADFYCSTGEVGPDLSKMILFVEDESFVREVTREVLRSAGYQVLIAKSAADAIDIYNERGSEVDLLLTDVILPGETGRTLAARLRRANPRLRVLYVTGYAEQMGLRGTANEDCLAKPFSTEVLLQRVKRMLARPEFLSGEEGGTRLACVGA